MKLLKYLPLATFMFLSGCATTVNLNPNSTSKILAPAVPPKIQMLIPWEKSRISIKCAAVETDSAGYKLQSVVFYQDLISDSSVMYVAKYSDYPVSIIPIRDDIGNLITIWDNGREYIVRVYGYIDGNIVLLFEDNSKTFPEMIYENNRMENISILITDTGLVKNKKTKTKDELPVNASIYRWKEGKYVKSAPVPWTKRFNPGK